MTTNTRTPEETLVGATAIARGKRFEVSIAPAPQAGWQPIVYLRLIQEGWGGEPEKLASWMAIRYDNIPAIVNLLDLALEQIKAGADAKEKCQ